MQQSGKHSNPYISNETLLHTTESVKATMSLIQRPPNVNTVIGKLGAGSISSITRQNTQKNSKSATRESGMIFKNSFRTKKRKSRRNHRRRKIRCTEGKGGFTSHLKRGLHRDEGKGRQNKQDSESAEFKDKKKRKDNDVANPSGGSSIPGESPPNQAKGGAEGRYSNQARKQKKKGDST